MCVCVYGGGNLEGPKAMHKQHSEMAGHDLDQKLSSCLYNQISCLDGKNGYNLSACVITYLG